VALSRFGAAGRCSKDKTHHPQRWRQRHTTWQAREEEMINSSLPLLSPDKQTLREFFIVGQPSRLPLCKQASKMLALLCPTMNKFAQHSFWEEEGFSEYHLASELSLSAVVRRSERRWMPPVRQPTDWR